MADPLDPYHKWLGIRDPQRPPNHYRLLGLDLFEDDADVISNAADRQMAYVRTFQLGPHAEMSQRLLNELAAAKVCLLDEHKKAEYDARLNFEAPSSGRAERALATSNQPARPSVTPVKRARSSWGQRWPVLVTVAVGLTVAAAMLAQRAGYWGADPQNKKPVSDGAQPSATTAPSHGTDDTERNPPVRPFIIFEDEPQFVDSLTMGDGSAAIESVDVFSGLHSVKITPEQRYNPGFPPLGAKIRERPGLGEYRFLRFAWKKRGGELISISLAHDGKWGQEVEHRSKFRYDAGTRPEAYGAALRLQNEIPVDWTLFTRDLFADFGEFNLTGIALSPDDGEFALFDHIYLARTLADFDLISAEIKTAPTRSEREIPTKVHR